MHKRHDLLSGLYSIISRSQDEVVVDIPMNDDAMEPFVFALVPKNEKRQYQKDYSDLVRFHSLTFGCLFIVCIAGIPSDYDSRWGA